MGDAEVARLLALAALPAADGTSRLRALVRSAIARLVRADAGALAAPGVRAVSSAVEAVCARGGAPVRLVRLGPP